MHWISIPQQLRPRKCWLTKLSQPFSEAAQLYRMTKQPAENIFTLLPHHISSCIILSCNFFFNHLGIYLCLIHSCIIFIKHPPPEIFWIDLENQSTTKQDQDDQLGNQRVQQKLLGVTCGWTISNSRQ